VTAEEKGPSQDANKTWNTQEVHQDWNCYATVDVIDYFNELFHKNPFVDFQS
jgi:hypothetical protein